MNDCHYNGLISGPFFFKPQPFTLCKPTEIQNRGEYLPMDGLVIAEGNDLSDDILKKCLQCFEFTHRPLSSSFLWFIYIYNIL